jgi:hypothetical protein
VIQDDNIVGKQECFVKRMHGTQGGFLPRHGSYTCQCTLHREPLIKRLGSFWASILELRGPRRRVRDDSEARGTLPLFFLPGALCFVNYLLYYTTERYCIASYPTTPRFRPLGRLAG